MNPTTPPQPPGIHQEIERQSEITSALHALKERLFKTLAPLLHTKGDSVGRADPAIVSKLSPLAEHMRAVNDSMEKDIAFMLSDLDLLDIPSADYFCPRKA